MNRSNASTQNVTMEHPRPSPPPPIDVDGHRQARKRSHYEMNAADNNIITRGSSSPISGPTNVHSHTHGESSQQNAGFSGRAPSRLRLSSPRSPAPRAPRSQVDLRRPVMPSTTLIDLTEDDSPPVRNTGPIRLRLPASTSPSPQRDPARWRPFVPYPEVMIVDLEDGETRAPRPRRSSPEIEITGERTVPRRERPTTVAHDEGGQQARRAGGHGRFGNLFNFLRNNPTDQALETFTAERQEQNAREDLERRQRVLNAIRDATGHHRHHRLPYEVAEVLIGHGRIDALEEGFELADDVPIPVMMDYVTPGFAMGRNQRPRSPPYIEPSPPPEGFIKSTEEDDIVICPNCNDELGVGQDPLKRQVWIAKSCGHVYCGECTKNRPVKRGPKASKMALKTKPFSKCIVEECGKSVSQPKAMIPLYL